MFNVNSPDSMSSKMNEPVTLRVSSSAKLGSYTSSPTSFALIGMQLAINLPSVYKLWIKSELKLKSTVFLSLGR